MSEQKLVIDPDGRLRFVWSDDLIGLLALGEARVTRASHVEPLPDGSGWTADLGPVGGPIIGPVGSRGEALSLELQWLERNLIHGIA